MSDEAPFRESGWRRHRSGRRPDPDPSARAGGGFTARDAVVLASWFGLVGGLLDLAVTIGLATYWYRHPYFWQGSYFPWATPAAGLVVVLLPGLAASAAARAWPGLVSHRGASWLFATLALWGPLLRLPLVGPSSFLLAAGLGRRVGILVGRHPDGFGRFARRGLIALAAVVASLAAATTGRRFVAEWRAHATLPARPGASRNVLLIVLDAVRARSLGLYADDRAPTPNLDRWARRGVRFDRALSPASWTFPSHASFFTGQWPHRLGLERGPRLPSGVPTIAEALAARGYRTGGFCANTMYCSYETGLDRGFAHFEDYPLTARAVLGSSPIGRWIVRQVLERIDTAELKWLRFQSRPAPQVHRAFLDWLGDGREGRPFFAFLNDIDAHEPFLLSEEARASLGLGREPAADRSRALEYWAIDKRRLTDRDVQRAREAYEECITYLDREVGALLDELDRRGVLRETIVIVTSDHGEQFGEHGGFNHGYSLYLEEIHVPLLIVGPTVPAGRVVTEPVSLRDLPATILELLGDASRPFPGRSLAETWGTQRRPDRPSSALSELVNPLVLNPRDGLGPRHRGFVTSVLDRGEHYIRDGASHEELYALESDSMERNDVAPEPDSGATLARLRRELGRILAEDEATGGPQPDYLRPYRQRLDGPAARAPAAR